MQCVYMCVEGKGGGGGGGEREGEVVQGTFFSLVGLGAG